MNSSISTFRLRVAFASRLLFITGWLGAGMSAHADTFTVTNTAGFGPGSLIAALQNANSKPGPHTINFQIPPADPNFVDVDSGLPGGDPEPDVYVIATANTPVLTASGGITINGASQTAIGGDTNPFGPEISISGNNFAGGFFLHHNNKLIGLNIRNFVGYGIVTTSGTNNVIRGCYIGTNPTGTAAEPNSGDGIDCSSSHNMIGGPGPLDGNVIAGNTGDQVRLRGAGADGNTIMGNKIGTNAAGTARIASAGDGIECHGPNNLIINNLLSGSEDAAGVRLSFSTSVGTRVVGNLIGTDITGVNPLPNREGIDIVFGATGTVIGGPNSWEGNVIAHNIRAGIRLGPNAGGAPNPVNNLITGNSIHSNGMLGISFSEISTTPVANDNCDADSGTNNLQNYPVLTSATAIEGGIRVQGSLNSIALKSFDIEFFANNACDGGGNGEGQFYLGSATVSTGVGCTAPIDVMLFNVFTNTVYITATASDEMNNTSEFSPCVPYNPNPLQCLLDPAAAIQRTNTMHSVTATVALNGVLQPGISVQFDVTAGPRAGQTASLSTDVNGQAVFEYAGSTLTGTDTIRATGSVGGTNFTAFASCDWEDTKDPKTDLLPELVTAGFTCSTVGETTACTTTGTLALKKKTKPYISGKFKATITQDAIATKVKANVSSLVVNLKKIPHHHVSVYLSTDDQLDDYDWLIKTVTVADIAKLAAAGKPLKLNSTLPPWLSLSGRYLILMVDSQFIVAESDEDNNVAVLGPLP